MKRIVLAFVIAVAVASAVAAQSFSLTTGQDYGNDWTTNQRLVYAVGYRGGFNMGAAAQKVGTYRRLSECMKDWPYAQLQAVVDKYVRDHIAEWHTDISLLTFNAISAACKP